jgi:ABC-type antimicrobial peptide transport system permease subunit
MALALFGIYAVVSNAVAQRTPELGLQLALGASRGQVLGLVLAHGGRLALVGVAIGVPAALALSGVLAGLLYEVRPTDTATFVGVSLGLALAAVVATIAPARRAASVDPLVAMRDE